METPGGLRGGAPVDSGLVLGEIRTNAHLINVFYIFIVVHMRRSCDIFAEKQIPKSSTKEALK